MRLWRWAVLFFCFSVLAGCNSEKEFENEPEPGEPVLELPDSLYDKGYIRVRVSEELAVELENAVQHGGVMTRSMSSDPQLGTLGVTSMNRTFPYAGEFEERTRKAGLHLWYSIEFDPNQPITRAGKSFSEIEGITEIEYRPLIIRNKSDVMEFIASGEAVQTANAESLPFNDPMLKDQWHYYNNGSQANSLAGSDINVFPVWKNYTAGSENVIVAIVDGGIDVGHEDLAANVWINWAEKNGARGYDDDSNGYRDDINGFNFVSNAGTIVPEDHGTHVAGTVGAVNNNGVGVSGVAGGDGTTGGVRLMSCQIFVPEDDPYADRGGRRGAEAIKYAADNGAVVCQNSWGYPSLNSIPPSDKEAIDYFIEYAGTDRSGTQIGPMKGGIVLFSAGNEDREGSAIGKYEKVVCVSAVAPDYRKAYYSNYGTFVGVSAPGGDYYYDKGLILSTAVGGYGRMQGTSMACPHVSGVAALLVSYFQGPALTPDLIRRRLEETATNIDSYNRGYAGKMGKGLVNTTAAIASSSAHAPDPVTTLTATVASNQVTLTWKVPADEDDVKPAGFTILSRRTSFEGVNSNSLPSDVVIAGNVQTGDAQVGEDIWAVIEDQEFNARYYFAVIGFDYSSNLSQIATEVAVNTEQNRPPVIEPQGSTSFILFAHESARLNLKISDPDGHTFTWAFSPGSAAATLGDIGNGTLQLSLSGKDAPTGNYTAVVSVTDKYGATVSQNIDYQIMQNYPPELLKNIDNQYFPGIGQETVIDLKEIFTDRNEEELRYSIDNSAISVVYASANNDQLHLTAARYGTARITVTASDAVGENVSTTFDILVRDGSQEVDLYPNPVKDFLNVRTGETGSYQIVIYNNSGAKVIDRQLQISPFAPGRIDFSGLSGGVYQIVIQINGKEVKSAVVKI